jgi:hypothetical protein
MSNATLRIMMEQSDREIRSQQRAKLEKQCQPDPSGNLIRGYVTSVRCVGCGHMRWDDGTACTHPGKFGNKFCNHRVNMALEEQSLG